MGSRKKGIAIEIAAKEIEDKVSSLSKNKSLLKSIEWDSVKVSSYSVWMKTKVISDEQYLLLWQLFNGALASQFRLVDGDEIGFYYQNVFSIKILKDFKHDIWVDSQKTMNYFALNPIEFFDFKKQEQ